jgi:hypothetical protein
MCAAYPGIPKTLHHRQGYRDPDSIKGGTWEALERILKRAGYYAGGLLRRRVTTPAGYYAGGLPKIEAARQISACMDPERNRSRSFLVFRQALRHVAMAHGALVP